MLLTFRPKVFWYKKKTDISNSLSVLYLVPKHFRSESQFHMIRHKVVLGSLVESTLLTY